MSLPHNKIPEALGDLAKSMAAPAMPVGEIFRPEAAIVNYFGLGILRKFLIYSFLLHLFNAVFFQLFVLPCCEGDTLGGHLDDMEKDWTKPIVSMRYIYKIAYRSRFFFDF